MLHLTSRQHARTYTHTRIHTCTHAYIHTHAHIHHVCMHARTHARTQTHRDLACEMCVHFVCLYHSVSVTTVNHHSLVIFLVLFLTSHLEHKASHWKTLFPLFPWRHVTLCWCFSGVWLMNQKSSNSFSTAHWSDCCQYLTPSWSENTR